MPEIQIQKGLWQNIVAIAEKQKQRPESLAQEVLREYVQRFTDEELLRRSSAAARRAPFRMQQTEQTVREFRRRKGT